MHQVFVAKPSQATTLFPHCLGYSLARTSCLAVGISAVAARPDSPCRASGSLGAHRLTHMLSCLQKPSFSRKERSFSFLLCNHFTPGRFFSPLIALKNDSSWLIWARRGTQIIQMIRQECVITECVITRMCEHCGQGVNSR